MRALLVALLAVAAPAWAGSEFAAYEGKDSVFEGTGGTRITKNGVDFWTSGQPARRFQVIGIITDERMDKLLSGKAIGSGGIAKKVKAAGGDAVIVLSQDSEVAGGTAFGNAFLQRDYVNAFGSSRVVHRKTTRLLVVKYL